MYTHGQEGPARMLRDPVALSGFHWWLDLQAGEDHFFVPASHAKDVSVAALSLLVLAPLMFSH